MNKGKIIIISAGTLLILIVIIVFVFINGKKSEVDDNNSTPPLLNTRDSLTYKDMIDLNLNRQENYKETGEFQVNNNKNLERKINNIYSNENQELDSLLETFKEEDKRVVRREPNYQNYNTTPTKQVVYSPAPNNTPVEIEEPTKKTPKSRFNYITEGVSSINSDKYEENKLYEAQILEAQIVSEKNPYIRIRTKQKIGEVPANTTLMAKVSFSESRIFITTDMVKINNKLIKFQGTVYNNLGQKGLDVKGGKGVEVLEELNKSGEGEVVKVVNEKVGWGGSLVNLIFKKKGKVKINSENIFLKMEKNK